MLVKLLNRSLAIIICFAATVTYSFFGYDAKTTKPKCWNKAYSITFSVVGNTGGKLTAKSYKNCQGKDSELISGKSVRAAGVSFYATPIEGYIVKEWKKNGNAVNNSQYVNSFYLWDDVKENTEVTVEFMPSPYLKLKFGVVGNKGGKIFAESEVIKNEYKLNEYKLITSGDSVPIMTNFRFLAMASDNYIIKKWTQNGKVISFPNYKYNLSSIKENTEIMVEFDSVPFSPVKLKFDVAGNKGGKIEAKFRIDYLGQEKYKYKSLNSGGDVPIDAIVELIAMPDSNYSVKNWKLNGKEESSCSHNNNCYVYYIKGNTEVNLEFIPNPTVTFNIEGDIGGNVEAEQNNVPLTSGTRLPYGSNVQFYAKPPNNYSVKKWKNNGEDIFTCKNPNKCTISIKDDANITVELMPNPIIKFKPMGYFGSKIVLKLQNAKGVYETIKSGSRVPAGRAVFAVTLYNNHGVRRWKHNGEIKHNCNFKSECVMWIEEDSEISVEFVQTN